jgi:hypothetical protein
LFVEDGNLVHRTYDRWTETASRNLGVYAGTPNPGLYYVNDAAGTRTYCMQTAGLADITALAGGRTLYACNDRYVISYAENGPWRIVDLTTKRQVFEAGGWIIFATKHEREHFIIARDKESLEIGVFDLERPQNGSMMSDYNIWQLPVQYGRQDGIFLFKSGNGVYMKSAL